MAIKDQNRSRKVYSFFRAAPVPIPVTGETDVLTFNNIGAMSAYDVGALNDGKMAYVRSLRDYFFIEKTVNSGSTDSIQDVLANGFLGVWHRMGLGAGYWKNQTRWFIDSETGNDENLGAADVPLKTLDELIRRLFGIAKLRSDYIVTLTSVTQSITNDYGIDLDLDGGSVTFIGVPRFSASLGTINSLQGGVDYASGMAPQLSMAITGSDNNNLLYVSSSQGLNPMAWSLAGEAGYIYTTPFATGAVGDSIFQAKMPMLNSPGVVAKGRGRVIFNNLSLGVSGNTSVVVASDDPATVQFILSSISSKATEFAGGNITLDRSRVRSTSGSIEIHNKTRMFASASGFTTQTRQNTNVRDSMLELGSTPLWNTQLFVKSSRLTLATLAASGSALCSSSLEVQSDSVVDVRNLISSKSIGNPVTVTGQNVTVFFDDANTPKADNVVVNNGVVPVSMTWSGASYVDLGRDTRVVSGSLQNVL